MICRKEECGIYQKNVTFIVLEFLPKLTPIMFYTWHHVKSGNHFNSLINFLPYLISTAFQSSTVSIEVVAFDNSSRVFTRTVISHYFNRTIITNYRYFILLLMRAHDTLKYFPLLLLEFLVLCTRFYFYLNHHDIFSRKKKRLNSSFTYFT